MIQPAHHINLDRYGYRVTVQRGLVRYRVSIPFTRPGALAEAIRHRDRFLARFQEVRSIFTRPRSNTGHIGISETTKSYRNHSLECFAVDWCRGGKHHNRRITYGAHRTRQEALRLAIALRRRHLPAPTEVAAHA